MDWDSTIILKCRRCGWLHIGVRADEINPADHNHFLTCECCRAPNDQFVQGTVQELPHGAGIRPRIIPAHISPGFQVGISAIDSNLEFPDAGQFCWWFAQAGVASSSMENLDETGFPVLPPAKKEADGKHWGMKLSIGWSNSTNCPDQAIVWHVLARANAAGIAEAVDHYGLDLVQAFWEAMKKNGPVKEKFTLYSFNNGDLIQSEIPHIDSILEKIARERTLCNHYVGYLYPEVPPVLVGGRPQCAMIMNSEVTDLIQSCRRYFENYPTTRQFNERFLVDDDAKQLNSLVVRFRFCPLCGEEL